MISNERSLLIAAWVAASLASACVPDPAPLNTPPATPSPPAPTPTPPPPTPDEPTFTDHWSPEQPADQGPKDLFPGIDREGRVARRLSVAQLRASIPALFGVQWDNGNRANPQNMFNVLSRTLGEADYVQVTQESVDPTPLFAKFMDDMAGQVCAKAVANDTAATDPNVRVVKRHADVDQNLRFLRLKLHGIYVPDGSTEGLGSLRALYDGVLADTSSVDQAWTGVCVAMLTAPEMMAY